MRQLAIAGDGIARRTTRLIWNDVRGLLCARSVDPAAALPRDALVLAAVRAAPFVAAAGDALFAFVRVVDAHRAALFMGLVADDPSAAPHDAEA